MSRELLLIPKDVYERLIDNKNSSSGDDQTDIASSTATSAMHDYECKETTPNTNDDMDELVSMCFLSKFLSLKVSRLYQFIKRSKNHVLSWNSNNQLLISENVVPGTNIIDLLRDAVNPRLGKSSPPRGYIQFYSALGRLNTPRSLITNTDRRALLDDTEGLRSESVKEGRREAGKIIRQYEDLRGSKSKPPGERNYTLDVETHSLSKSKWIRY
jgi:hypothetical protein